MSLNDQETESIDPTPSSDDGCSLKKPYERAVLFEWGTIHELTAGPLNDIQDDGLVHGSGGE
jgi:hypothetical protein